MSGQHFTVSTDSDLDNIFLLIRESVAAFGTISVEISKVEKTRTHRQNSCLHAYLTQLATALNNAGYDMKRVLKPELEIPWTMQLCKDHLWRPIQQAMTEKASTTEATTVEYQEIYRVLDRHLSQKLGVHIEWPTRFNQ